MKDKNGEIAGYGSESQLMLLRWLKCSSVGLEERSSHEIIQWTPTEQPILSN